MSTSEEFEEFDAMIVGAGPVGLALAILLGQRGRSVLVAEQWPDPYPLPRAVHFDHEVGRILQACGVGDAVRRIIEPAPIYEWQNAAGVTLLRFGGTGDAASGWPGASMFSQPQLEALLVDRLHELPSVTLRRSTRVEGFRQDPDGVSITCVQVERGDGDELFAVPSSKTNVRAGYLVGCDGANSTVRELLDGGMDDRGFFFDWLIVDLIPDDMTDFDMVNLQTCDPSRPTTAVSGGPGRRRWEFMRLPDEPVDELVAEDNVWRLLAPWGARPDNSTIERRALYTFQARAAKQWRDGRVLLAGDAAHQMPPFAGQGMCAGIRDAANLAWKLDLVVGGRADGELLAAYDIERRPSANAAIDISIELGKVICVPDPEAAAARDAAMSAEFDGTTSSVPPMPGVLGGIIREGSAHAGELLPQAKLGEQWFDDVHGVGFRLLTIDPASADLPTDLDDWLSSIGGKVVVIDTDDGAMRDWLENREIGWALQRPDFYAYGTATDAAGAGGLLSALRAQLTAPNPSA